jgi:hypothetical protein
MRLVGDRRFIKRGEMAVVRTRIWFAGMFAILVVGMAETRGMAAIPSEALLPNTARGFVSVTNPKTLVEHWNQTQLGQLVNDPVMKPFVTDLRRQFDERWSNVREKLGLTVDDLRDVAGGEVAVALVQPAPDKAAALLVADVTGHPKETQTLLAKVNANLIKQHAAKSQLSAAGATVLVYTLPKPEDLEPNQPAPQVALCLKGELLIASNSLDLVKGVLRRAGGAKGDSLADDKAFTAVMNRCKADAGDSVPQVRWYIQPVGYIEAMRAAQTERHRRKGRTILDAFKAQGFMALQGVGGYVDFFVEKRELIHRTAVFAPPPYEKSMNMLRFPNGQDFAPQPWVPSDISDYCSFYCDVQNAFANFASLFDELYNEGAPGLWDDVIQGLKTDPSGPRTDIKKDLISQLGNRITVVTTYQLPITPTSERLLIAIEAKDEKALAAGVRKLFEKDKEMQRREFEGYEIWESVPMEKAAVPSVSLELPGLGKDETVKSTHHGPQQGLMPNQAFVVAKGHLFIASQYEFITKILAKNSAATPLSRSVDYQLVSKSLTQFGMKAKSLANFAETEEQFRPTYELIRQGKMPQSETVFGRIVNTVMGAGKKGVLRKQEIDGSKMPDFEFVRRNLGPSGLQVISEEDGWFIKGCLLTKGG